jgi:large subunit ribosomal protein L25
LELKLIAEKRDETGKGAARKARARGEVPGVMYGLGEAPVSLMVKKEDLSDAIASEAGLNVLLDLEVVEGKNRDNHLVMIKELQKHPFKEKLLHVDFLKVARDTKVTMKVPISIQGEETSAGLKAGGTLQHNLWEIEIECLPGDVPDHVFADVTEMEVGSHLSVSDLSVAEGVTVLTEPADMVVTILPPRLVAEEEEEEAAAREEAAEEGPAAAPPEGGEEE